MEERTEDKRKACGGSLLDEAAARLGRLALEQEQARQQSLKHEAEVLLVAVPLVTLCALAAGVAAAESLPALRMNSCSGRSLRKALSLQHPSSSLPYLSWG